MWKKQIFASVIGVQKENFSEIIELKFGKKLPYFVCTLTAF